MRVRDRGDAAVVIVGVTLREVWRRCSPVMPTLRPVGGSVTLKWHLSLAVLGDRMTATVRSWAQDPNHSKSLDRDCLARDFGSLSLGCLPRDGE
jgi:hypothetical protein